MNYTSVSLDTRIPRDTVQRCIQETLVLLSYTLAKQQDVDFVFKDLGCLRFRKNRVKMQFSADFVSTLDSTGRLLHSLLSVSVSLGRHCHGFLGDALKGRWQWLLLVGLTRLLLRRLPLALAQSQAGLLPGCRRSLCSSCF